MADISKELERIRAAIYGEEVRKSIVDGMSKLNNETEKTLKEATEAIETANEVSHNTNNAMDYITKRADNTINIANEVLDKAENAASDALDSEMNAKGYMSAASGYASEAKEQASTAYTFTQIANDAASDALDSEMNAKEYMRSASSYASESDSNRYAAETYANEAERYYGHVYDIYNEINNSNFLRPRGSYRGNIDDLYKQEDIGTWSIVVNVTTGTFHEDGAYKMWYITVLPINTNECIQIGTFYNGDGNTSSAVIRSRWNNNVWDKWTYITNNSNYYETAPFNQYGNASSVKNGIWRGKHLGDHLTQEQLNAIRSDTLNDLFLGDYWTAPGKPDYLWRIVGFNCCPALDGRNHIVVMPDLSYSFGPFASEYAIYSQTEYFVPSDMLYKTLNDFSTPNYAALDALDIFGEDHMLPHHYTTPIAIFNYGSEKVFDYSVFTSKVTIPSVYNVFEPGERSIMGYGEYTIGSGWGHSISANMFPAFRLRPYLAYSPNLVPFVVIEPPYMIFERPAGNYGMIKPYSGYSGLTWSEWYGPTAAGLRPYVTIG